MGFLSSLITFGDEEAGKQEVKNIISGLPNQDTGTTQENIVNKVLFYLGIIAVVMIIVSGARMALSGGNPSAVTKAKQMLIYSLIGLAIVILAYAIVNFVLVKVLQ